MSKKTVVVIGGDNRQTYLFNFLVEDKIDTKFVELESLKQSLPETAEIIWGAKIVVFPIIRNQQQEIKFILSCLKKQALFIAGGISNSLIEEMNKREIAWFDYLKSESLLVLNAVPTAEGALMIAFSRSDKTMFKSRCAITGYGKVAKRLAMLLKSVGAVVVVAARSTKDRANAFADGVEVVELSALKTITNSFDFLFNTIPNVVIDKAVLDSLNKDCEIIDISSFPGGVDFEYAKHLGINATLDLALPGKVAPKSAAQYLKLTLLEHLNERGIFF